MRRKRITTTQKVGIAITDRSISAVCVEDSLGYSKIKDFFSKELPQGVIEKGIIRDPEYLFNIARTLRLDLGVAEARFSIPDTIAYTFNISIPYEGESADALIYSYIQRNHSDINIDEYVLDYSTLFEGGGYAEYAVSLMPAEMVSMYVDVLEEAGFVPLSIELHHKTLLPAVGKGEHSLVVNVGETDSLIMVLANGSPEYRSFCAHDHIEESMSGIAMLRDEIMKRIHVWDVLQEAKGLAAPLSCVVLSGEQIERPGVFDMLSSRIPLRCERVNTLANMKYSPGEVPMIHRGMVPRYSPAIGLVML